MEFACYGLFSLIWFNSVVHLLLTCGFVFGVLGCCLLWLCLLLRLGCVGCGIGLRLGVCVFICFVRGVICLTSLVYCVVWLWVLLCYVLLWIVG